MSRTACLVGRTAVIVLRTKSRAAGARRVARPVTVAFPAEWSKSTFLAYCRREHPNETVRLVEWRPISKRGRRSRADLWIANPAAFRNYREGEVRE